MDRKKIEDLSNLVFGLALALGAFSLIKPVTDDLASLFNTIVQFGLSFAVIIWIWWLYNRMVNEQDLARKGMVPLNILMLFLVVIEPFLLSVSQSYSSGKVAYSLDLGITLLIMALLTNTAAPGSGMEPAEPERRRRRANRYLSLLCAAIFFVSLVPQLLLGQTGENIQSVMWLSALFIGVVGRRVLLR